MKYDAYQTGAKEWLKVVEQKRRPNTFKTYHTAIKHFLEFAQDTGIKEINGDTLSQYRKMLEATQRAGNISTDTANMRITALNMSLKFLDQSKLILEPFKAQTVNFLDDTITESDYNRLIRWADKLGMKREKLLMETLAGTGVRIGELEYFTVDAVKASDTKAGRGEILVVNKGKQRKIFIPDKVRKDLLIYIKQEDIKSGLVFHGKDPDKLLDKALIWRNLQKIAGKARVKKSKVHAHSFRHLFAKRYQNMFGEDNILPLADLLGHSNLETTRRYTRKTSREQKEIVNRLFNQND